MLQICNSIEGEVDNIIKLLAIYMLTLINLFANYMYVRRGAEVATYTRQAVKDLKRLPRNDRVLILSKIQQLEGDPASLANNIKKLQGVEAYRLRVGNYRVIYSAQGEILMVLRVAPRGSAYN